MDTIDDADIAVGRINDVLGYAPYIEIRKRGANCRIELMVYDGEKTVTTSCSRRGLDSVARLLVCMERLYPLGEED